MVQGTDKMKNISMTMKDVIVKIMDYGIFSCMHRPAQRKYKPRILRKTFSYDTMQAV